MKILLDECVNRRIVRHHVGHDVRTVRQMGWTGIKNGKLLSLAEIEFDVFTTIDKNLQFQQSIRKYDLAIIVLDVRSNHITELLPFLPLFIAALPVAPKGEVTPIARPQPTP